MAGLEDIHGYGEKFDQQRELLKQADIEDRDRQAITRFVRDSISESDRGRKTTTNHLNRLRLIAERADMPLVEMGVEDVKDHLYYLSEDRGLSEGTVRNYRKTARVFFRHRGEDWADEIKIGAAPDRTVTEDDLLDQDQIDALFDAAKNARDKALLAMLLDTGLRIGALASLRVRDIELTEHAGLVTLNSESADRKGANGTVPLTWARSYVGNWLSMHPDRRDDAPLFHSLRPDMDTANEDGSLTYQHLLRHLKRLADRTDCVSRDEVNPHRFRKTAISQWIREGLTEQEIKHRACWAKDSTQFEIYSGITDEELNEQILDSYGLADAEDARPSLDHCQQCGIALQRDPHYCPGCGVALTREAGETESEATTAVAKDAATLDGVEAEVAADLVDDLMNDAEFRERVANRIAEDHGSSP